MLILNGQTVGYLTEIGELVVGLVLVGAAAAFILAPDRLSRATHDALFGSTAISTSPALRRLRALPGAGSRTAPYETR